MVRRWVGIVYLRWVGSESAGAGWDVLRAGGENIIFEGLVVAFIT